MSKIEHSVVKQEISKEESLLERKDSKGRYSIGNRVGLALIISSIAIAVLGALSTFLIYKNILSLPASFNAVILSTKGFSFAVGGIGAVSITLFQAGLMVSTVVSAIAGTLLFIKKNQQPTSQIVIESIVTIEQAVKPPVKEDCVIEIQKDPIPTQPLVEASTPSLEKPENPVVQPIINEEKLLPIALELTKGIRDLKKTGSNLLLNPHSVPVNNAGDPNSSLIGSQLAENVGKKMGSIRLREKNMNSNDSESDEEWDEKHKEPSDKAPPILSAPAKIIQPVQNTPPPKEVTWDEVIENARKVKMLKNIIDKEIQNECLVLLFPHLGYYKALTYLSIHLNIDINTLIVVESKGGDKMHFTSEQTISFKEFFKFAPKTFFTIL